MAQNDNQQKDLNEAILRAIVFYDMFDCPLAAFEIWTYCEVKCALSDVITVLNNLPVLDTKSGYYFLRGREAIVNTRLKNYNHASRKFKRALRVARLFKLIPWIRLIAIGNQMGANNLRDESDIDFFIITEPKRIWITRWFCAGIAKILKLRPQPDKKRDTICLSFYISSERMDTSDLQLRDNLCPDVYFLHWLVNLTPIYSRDGAYHEFIAANSWIKDFFPNWEQCACGYRRDAGPGFSAFYRDCVDLLIGNCDTIAKRIQLRILPAALRNAMNLDTRTIVNDQILKLYINDRRAEYRGRFISKCREVIANF